MKVVYSEAQALVFARYLLYVLGRELENDARRESGGLHVEARLAPSTLILLRQTAEDAGIL